MLPPDRRLKAAYPEATCLEWVKFLYSVPVVPISVSLSFTSIVNFDTCTYYCILSYSVHQPAVYKINIVTIIRSMPADADCPSAVLVHSRPNNPRCPRNMVSEWCKHEAQILISPCNCEGSWRSIPLADGWWSLNGLIIQPSAQWAKGTGATMAAVGTR